MSSFYLKRKLCFCFVLVLGCSKELFSSFLSEHEESISIWDLSIYQSEIYGSPPISTMLQLCKSQVLCPRLASAINAGQPGAQMREKAVEEAQQAAGLVDTSWHFSFPFFLMEFLPNYVLCQSQKFHQQLWPPFPFSPCGSLLRCILTALSKKGPR